MRSAILLVVTLFAACCPCPKPGEPIGKLPPPISIQEQVSELNERARALPLLRVSGTLVLRYHDENDKLHQQTIDKFLLLVRQRFGAENAADPADAYMRGSVLASERFYGGKNQQKWWFVNKDEKLGWMGDVQAGADGRVPTGNVMRADLMVQVLGITEINLRRDEVLSMKVHDSTGKNELDILRLRNDATAWTTRNILIDRISGEVSQVAVATPSGRLAVKGKFSEHRPVTYAEGVTAASHVPNFPHDIWVDYPAQKLNVHFTVDTAEVVGSLPERPFETPDFADLGIKKADNENRK